jgi:hypothetical protein
MPAAVNMMPLLTRIPQVDASAGPPVLASWGCVTTVDPESPGSVASSPDPPDPDPESSAKDGEVPLLLLQAPRASQMPSRAADIERTDAPPPGNRFEGHSPVTEQRN